MKVLVDTSVWSLALRRRAPVHPCVDELRRLIESGRAGLIGPVRQELLSGIRDAEAFEHLRDRLGSFPDELLTTSDYERAAQFFNTCRTKGLQGSNTDFLLCAVSAGHRMPLLTTDQDGVGQALSTAKDAAAASVSVGLSNHTGLALISAPVPSPAYANQTERLLTQATCQQRLRAAGTLN